MHDLEQKAVNIYMGRYVTVRIAGVPEDDLHAKPEQALQTISRSNDMIITDQYNKTVLIILEVLPESFQTIGVYGTALVL
eukprot:1979-Amphidinium_carterae.1